MNDGGPAFPQIESEYSPVSHEYTGNVYSSGGMTLRDYFAAAIASGVVSRRSTDDRYGVPPKELAKLAYECADAMLKERET